MAPADEQDFQEFRHQQLLIAIVNGPEALSHASLHVLLSLAVGNAITFGRFQGAHASRSLLGRLRSQTASESAWTFDAAGHGESRAGSAVTG